MAPEGDRLRRLAAELTAELERILRTAREAASAYAVVSDPAVQRIAVYGAAALLDTFYTGVEKALARVAGAFGGTPQGAAWHRELLEDAAIDVPKVRPAVLRETTARKLEPYLAFRHRFRNLYMFDLEPAQMSPLLAAVEATRADVEADLRRFAATLLSMADAVESGG